MTEDLRDPRVSELAANIEMMACERDPSLRVDDATRNGIRIAAAWYLGKLDAEGEHGPHTGSGTPARKPS